MDASVRDLNSEQCEFVEQREYVCVCVYIHVVAGQIRARTWCC